MNQDSAVVTTRLLAVADGMGGHAHGEVASSVAIGALIDLDRRLPADLAATDLAAALGEAVVDAADRLTELAKSDPELRGTGTTVVALLMDGGRIGVAHIGDSRAYLLREGELFRLTRDHTLVQALLDEGRITPEEAAGHPRRSWLVRTLQEATPVEPDLFAVDGRVGDRFLICSDGATAVLDDEALRVVLGTVADPSDAVDRLIELANEGGGPDNITCIVADLVEGEPGQDPPVVVGAAASQG
jgi:protein phosphatase